MYNNNKYIPSTPKQNKEGPFQWKTFVHKKEKILTHNLSIFPFNNILNILHFSNVHWPEELAQMTNQMKDECVREANLNNIIKKDG